MHFSRKKSILPCMNTGFCVYCSIPSQLIRIHQGRLPLQYSGGSPCWMWYTVYELHMWHAIVEHVRAKYISVQVGKTLAHVLVQWRSSSVVRDYTPLYMLCCRVPKIARLQAHNTLQCDALWACTVDRLFLAHDTATRQSISQGYDYSKMQESK